jgi:peroxiredoxin family protein
MPEKAVPAGRQEKFNVVVFSGDLDKVLAAFILATTSASMGMEVNMFFTFWGLNVLRKNKFTSGKNLLQKMMNFMNKGGAGRLPLSKFNLLGLGPFMMKIMMRQSNVPSIEEFIKMAKEMGIKLTACTTTFSFMGFKKEDFIEGIDAFAGAATYLSEAREGKISYFI